MVGQGHSECGTTQTIYHITYTRINVKTEITYIGVMLASHSVSESGTALAGGLGQKVVTWVMGGAVNT